MSLINDALKRARETQPPAAANSPASPPLRPVESAPATAPRSSVLLPALGTAAVLIALFSAWQWLAHTSLVKATSAQDPSHLSAQPAAPANSSETGLAGNSTGSSPPSEQTTAPQIPSASSPVAPVAQASPSSVVPTPPGPSASSTPPASADPTATANPSSDAANVAATAQTPPKPTPLRLQSIVYNPTRPSAMISGKVLFVGDRIGEFRVFAITAESATLVGAGHTNLLSLSQ